MTLYNFTNILYTMYVKSKQPPCMSPGLASTCYGFDPTCKKETTPPKKQATTGGGGKWWSMFYSCTYFGKTPTAWFTTCTRPYIIIPTVNLCWALGPVDFPDRAGLLVSFSEFLMPYRISASLASPMSRNHPYQLSLQLPVR